MEAIPKLNLKGNESILDIGCGDGKISVKLKTLLPHGEVVGIDSSCEMIQFANKTYLESDNQGISFHTMDATQISFDRGFDIVFSNSALHWVKDQLSVLKCVNKCLKKNGRIFFQMTGKGSMENIIHAFIHLLEDKKWQPYFTEIQFSGGFFTEDQYRNWLKETEFHPVRVELVKKEIIFSGKTELEGHILAAWHPITERVPEIDRNAFVSDLVDRYLKIVPVNGDGFPTVEVVRLEVEAVKP